MTTTQPIIIFDHINQVATVAQPGPVPDKELEAVMARQREQVTSSGGSPAR